MKTIKLMLVLALFPAFMSASEDIGGGQIWPEFTKINVDSLYVWALLDLDTHGATFSFTAAEVDSINTQHLVVDADATIDSI